MISFQKSFETVHALAQDFEEHRASYTLPAYSEMQLRTDFVDKLLTALGWDVGHVHQKNPFQQEVKIERIQADGPAKRRADYALFIGPNFNEPRVYVEAKKPSFDLATRDNYFQAVRYGWNSQHSIVVLTNFIETHLLDCRAPPDIETVLRRRAKSFTLADLQDKEKFGEMYFLLSRDSVAAGALEEFAASLPRPRGPAVQRGLFKGGYQRLDRTFLAELEEYRADLARSLHRLNPTLGGYELTEVTQRILDRLIFIRFLEDRLIESRYLVGSFGGRGSVWDDFVRESKRLDGVYNGVVFKRHALIDTGAMHIDEDTFGNICDAMSHYNSPYDFNFIPLHLLGSIYERFLGRVVTISRGRAVIEDKPEVRKAGGVYYTPDYVVQRLVDQTVRTKVRGKSPAQMARLRFCDLSCGSGSFLLGVFDALLDEHRAWYNANPARAAREGCYKADDGVWHLPLSLKRSILVNCIFGVDIDPQAVEVAQVSLYLKLLEEETTASAKQYELAMHETLLPSLGDNIICGNSIIENDIPVTGMFPVEDQRKLNACDLDTVFSRIMAGGGFDAIVGNPPYVRPHNVPPIQKEYFWKRWNVYTAKSDIYGLFIERATGLLKPDGMLGYILSKGWMRLDSFRALRRHILQHYKVLELCEMPHRVFEDAAVDTNLLVLEREADSRARRRNSIQVMDCDRKTGEFRFLPATRIPQRTFEAAAGSIFDTSVSPDTEAIKKKMRKGVQIGLTFDVKFGLKTGDDAKFIHRRPIPGPRDKRLLRGEDVHRYGYAWKGEYVRYLPEAMRKHRATARPGEADRFERPKVLVKDTTKILGCAYEAEHHYVKDVLIVVPKSGGGESLYDLRFVAAVINSDIMTFFYRTTYNTLHVQSGELSSLPLPKLDPTNPRHKALHDEAVQAVRTIEEAVKAQSGATTDRDEMFFRRRRESLDARLEAIIAELYGLSVPDRKLIATIVAGME